MAVLLALVFAVTPVLSQQQQQEEHQWFVRTVYLDRVYAHRLGYKLVYSTQDLRRGEAYLPIRWFLEAAGNAELVYTRRTSVPYLEVYYRDGEFSHLRLFVHADETHSTWASLDLADGEDSEFEIGEFQIRY
jgi:hypothetical protein